MCEGAETWAQRASDLAAEVVRLEDVVARCDEEIARLHDENLRLLKAGMTALLNDGSSDAR